jgi:hypothetical protein
VPAPWGSHDAVPGEASGHDKEKKNRFYGKIKLK